jgi:hypothetical protein
MAASFGLDTEGAKAAIILLEAKNVLQRNTKKQPFRHPTRLLWLKQLRCLVLTSLKLINDHWPL